MSEDNYKKFAKITIYDENLPKGFFFPKKTIGKSLNANNKYPKKYFNSDDSDYQYEGWSSQSVQVLVRINKEIEIERDDKKEKIKNIKQEIQEKYKQKMQAENARKQRHEEIKQTIRNKYIVKQRANAKAEKNLAKRNITTNIDGGAGNVVGNISAADRQKLLSGNYVLATFYIPPYNPGSTFRFLGWPYKLPLRNSSSSSLTLRFSQVKESIPNSDPAKGNTLVPSDRIKVHARDYGDYSYIAWGSWSGGKNTRVLPVSGNPRVTSDGHWLYGQKLGRADIPRSGSARYVGQLMGGWRSNTVREIDSITGDINMAVTFRDSNFDLSGAMNLSRNGKAWATARFMHNSNNTVSDTAFLRCCHHFSTSLINANFSGGAISGSFFGANAAEVGGNFYVIKSGKDGRGYAEGVFRAKKQ